MNVKEKKFVLISRKKTAEKVQQVKERKPRRRVLVVLSFILAICVGLYCTAIFSGIPIIKKWRDIYIETAMDTYSHKWLATMFIPKYLIDDVLNAKLAYIASQEQLVTTWDTKPSPSPSVQSSPSASISPEEAAKAELFEKFPEISKDTFEAYVAKNPDVVKSGYAKLLINKSGLKDSGTTIYTTKGDQILVIDAENGIIITKVTGDEYVGKLAIIKNPAQVRVGLSEYLGSIGQTVSEIAKNNKAVLAINASGFADPEWEGNGGQVVGLVIANGKTLHQQLKNGYLTIGFSYENRLYIGESPSQIKFRDAIEFMPALIVNGKNVTDGSTGFGIQPRSTIGQAEDGTVYLLTIDGRQVGYSLGTTVGVCADILTKYGAVQASNLDGGSSTIMIYRDEIITKTSGLSADGRLVPDALIVDYASKVTQ